MKESGIFKCTSDRIIFHVDLNSFFASVETVLHPEYRGKAIAVCGDTEKRHGIVLAKSEPAKAAGVKTGMPNWQAKLACPELLIVHPEYSNYSEFSKLAYSIYERYTDNIESFGIDECWLDMTPLSKNIYDAYYLADDIRKTVSDELGLTVSVGVSFNKVFAKLGSDMKKPDAVTCIPYENFLDIIGNLPADAMIGVGRAAEKVLRFAGINTIGELAAADPEWLEFRLGKCGRTMWEYANGFDRSPVLKKHYKPQIKSVGHGTTMPEDMTTCDEVKCVMLELCQDIGYRLRMNRKKARGVSVTVRDRLMNDKEWQTSLPYITSNADAIAAAAYMLFLNKYKWTDSVRAVTVRAIDLVSEDTPEQMDLFSDYSRILKNEQLDKTIDEIRYRYGNSIIRNASLLSLHNKKQQN